MKESITMADLAGDWNTGASSATPYVNSYTGNYAGTETTIALAALTIKSDGTLDMNCVQKANPKLLSARAGQTAGAKQP